jgi:hypothetical protein
MRLTVKQLILGDQFNQIASMSAKDVAEFQKDLAQHFQGDYGNVAFKRATTAIGERIHQLNTQFISPYREMIAGYEKYPGQSEKVKAKIAAKMDKSLDELSDEQLESFYNQSIEDKRSESIATQQRAEHRDAAHMAELISRSNQPSEEKLASIKAQHLHASKQRLMTLDRDGKMSEQAISEYHEQAEADAQASVDNFVKVQTGAF